MYIIGELLLLVNFFMNALIIWITAKIMNYPLLKSRWLPGVSLASLYFIFPVPEGIPAALLKIILSCIVVMIVFFPRKLKEALTILTVFYGVSFFLGGGMFGFVFMIESLEGIAHGQLSWKYLSFSLALGGAIIWGVKCLEKKLKNKNYEIIVKVKHGDRACEFKALVDTGNLLKSPLGTPCIIIEKEAVRELLPYYVFDTLNETTGIYNLYEEIDSNINERYKFQPVFYNTVGEYQDVLLAFKPESIILHDVENKKSAPVESLLALSKNKLNLPEGYFGLLPPGLI